MKDYKYLISWQKSMQLAVEVYRLTKLLPKEETYGLASQVRRAVVSVSRNIERGLTSDNAKT
ncbi:MAG: four helix bundle protein [Oscillospiraceae bacterium]|nr:four helix bundle protein [Oscillospiraceae bacterium]